METKDVEGYEEPITCMTWDDVFERLVLVDRPGNVIYGLPPGGMIAAGFLQGERQGIMSHGARPTTDPIAATHILIDVLYSPEQQAALEKQFPDSKIVNLFDKTGCDRNKGILVMPWEEEPRELKPRPTTSPGMTSDEWAAFEATTGLVERLNELEGEPDVDVDRCLDHVGAIQHCLLAAPTRRIMAGRGV